MTKELTDRQRDILDVIREQIEVAGVPPTVREIGERFGFASSTVFQHLAALEKKGYIRRTGSQGVSRGIEVVGLNPGEAVRAMKKIPLVGRVAAGAPVLAEENIEGFVYADSRKVRGDEIFGLRVKGDSMIDAGIMPGDMLLVRKQNTAANGDIVVALIGDEATVKRFVSRDKSIFLQPENDSYEPIPFTRDMIILGKVVCVQRMLEET